jgi:hypothetical protein
MRGTPDTPDEELILVVIIGISGSLITFLMLDILGGTRLPSQFRNILISLRNAWLIIVTLLFIYGIYTYRKL